MFLTHNLSAAVVGSIIDFAVSGWLLLWWGAAREDKACYLLHLKMLLSTKRNLDLRVLKMLSVWKMNTTKVWQFNYVRRKVFGEYVMDNWLDLHSQYERERDRRQLQLQWRRRWAEERQKRITSASRRRELCHTRDIQSSGGSYEGGGGCLSGSGRGLTGEDNRTCVCFQISWALL